MANIKLAPKKKEHRLEERAEELKEKTDEELFEELKREEEEKQKKEEEKKAKEKIKEMEQGDKKETREERFAREAGEKLELWVPKTQLGRDVKSGKIKDIEEIFNSGKKIMEPQIVDLLLKNLKSELLFIGQAKGKFGGGKRRAWRQTQKKTKEGNVMTFSVMAVVGNEGGYMGVGIGKASETLPAREKAIRKAKLNIQRVERGCGSYNCSCKEQHSIPIEVIGKCSSVIVDLIPAPQGTGLVVGDELKKVLKLAGIKDVYSRTFGKTRTTINMVQACMDALTKLGEFKL